MTDAEVDGLLNAGRVAVVATNGRDGWPHVMPLWYVVRGGEVWAWTFAKSQKVRNLERDARATVQIEAGDSYGELRGVVLECEAVIHRDVDAVVALGLELAARYGDGSTPPEAAVAGVQAQAPKRVALQFAERRRTSWDHRKLARPS
jgi:PPOX class probable F420-dependent enzyme